MSRSQLTILTNICLIEDLETQCVVMQYRAPETNRWSGYAFPGGHVENGEAFAESVIREIYEETGLTIQNPQLVGVKNWPLDTRGALHCLLLQGDRVYWNSSIFRRGRSFLGAKRPDSKLESGL